MGEEEEEGKEEGEMHGGWVERDSEDRRRSVCVRLRSQSIVNFSTRAQEDVQRKKKSRDNRDSEHC